MSTSSDAKRDTSKVENSSPDTVTRPTDAGDTYVGDATSVNPTLTENECEEQDLERLKGDAIGDTLYSERFVLNTLLKLGQLSKDLQDEDDLERDLCSLWDMTIEHDVVTYLLEQDILELFAGIIKATDDKRLTEILVGILANMCNVAETREKLETHDEVIELLLELASCMDALTLEQVMRLWAVVFVKMKDDKAIKWYSHILKSDQFLESLCFILSNAASNTLILQTMETLNAILAKFTIMEIPDSGESKKKPPFEKLFIKSFLVEATIESLTSLVKDTKDSGDSYEESDISESVIKAKQTFCNIHSILTQYGETSKESYESHNDKILWCLKIILKPIAGEVKVSMWQQYEQDVLESVNDILRVLQQPFDVEIAQYLLKLYFEVSSSQEEYLRKNSSKTNDFEEELADDAEEIDYQHLITLILNTIYFLILKADKEVLKQCVSICPRKYATKLMETFEEPVGTESLKACHQKLKDVLEIE